MVRTWYGTVVAVLALLAGCSPDAARPRPDATPDPTPTVASTPRPGTAPTTRSDRPADPPVTALKPTRTVARDDTVEAVAFSPDGKLLAAADQLGKVQVWDFPAMTERAAFMAWEKENNLRCRVVFSPDSKTLAVSTDKALGLWDAATGAAVGAFGTGPDTSGRIQALAFSPDGKTLASGAWDYKITLWDVATREAGKTLQIEEFEGVWSLAYRPDGKVLAAGYDARLVLWDVAAGKQTVLTSGPSGADSGFGAVAFTPDGKTLAAGSGSGPIRLWDVATGKETAVFTAHTKSVRAVAFGPGGRTLVSGSWDRTLRFWDVTARRPTAVGTTRYEVIHLDLHPAGTSVATGGEYKTLVLWDGPAGR